MRSAWRGWFWTVALLAGLSASGVLAADPLTDARVLEYELRHNCLSAFDPTALLARVAALKAAFVANPEQLYATAPEALLAAARVNRTAHDYAHAREDLRALKAQLKGDHPLRVTIDVEWDAIEAEEMALAGGLAPPGPGWILFQSHPVPLPGVLRAVAAIWTGPDCGPRVISDGLYRLQLYVQTTADRPIAAVGEPVIAEEHLMAKVVRHRLDLTGTGALILQVSSDQGGNCWGCDEMRLFRASIAGLQELVLQVPDFIVAKRIEALGDGGQPAVMAIDTRWEEFGDVCHVCLSGTEYYFRWHADRFVEACSAAAPHYRESRRLAAEALAKATSVSWAFGAAVERLLEGIQLGEIDQAWTDFVSDLAKTRSLPEGQPDHFAAEELKLRQAVDLSRGAMTSRGCPLLGLDLPED